jgi:hypothetical protein
MCDLRGIEGGARQMTARSATRHFDPQNLKKP